MKKITVLIVAVLFALGLILSTPVRMYAAQEDEDTEIELQDDEKAEEYDRKLEDLPEEADEEEGLPEEEEQRYPDEKYQDYRG